MKLFRLRMIKMINILLLVILVISLAFNSNCGFSKFKARSFEKNTNLLEKKVNPKIFKDFIKHDEAYLTCKNPNKDILEKEILELRKLLKALDNEAINYKGVKIFEASSSFKNTMIRTALDNRISLLNNKDNFQYNKDKCYTLDRKKIEFDSCMIELTEAETDFNVKMLIQVLDNIERDLDFLENTSFIISPHKMDGINAYTISRKNNTNTVVIANGSYLGPRNWREMKVKSTILHEMGHVFYDYHTSKLNNINSSYLIETEQELSRLSKENKKDMDRIYDWKHSKGENFAEDFRIFHSKRLGDKSFSPLKKKTVLPYNETLFKNLIKDLDM